MNWQFTGVGPHNKGAELMFLAMREQVRRMDPDGRIAMLPGPSVDYEWRARNGLWQVFDPQQSGRLGWLRERAFSASYRQHFGMLHQKEIDIVLDASGYALGDPWKAAWVEATADYYERLKHQHGCRIILLPQAFGPFEKPRVRAAASRILDVADRVFARDSESLRFARSLAARPQIITPAPDFTNLLRGRLPVDWHDASGCDVALVPNQKMLDHGSDAHRHAYLPAMVRAMRDCRAGGLRPFVLIHESRDLAPGREIAAAAGLDDAVYQHSDPLDLKGILGQCLFSVGSRFHGLINCLSQGVPAIGTTWSHKYRHLFDDYSASEWLVDEPENVGRALARIGDEQERNEVSETLQAAAAPLRRQARAMWQEVEEVTLAS